MAPPASIAFTGTRLLARKRAKRATYYRIFIKVIGTDADFRQILPNPQGLSLPLEDLPPGATVEARLTAANEAGEAEQTVKVNAVVG